MSTFVKFIIGGLITMIALSSHAASFTIKSSAFSDNGMIPKRYTCEGGDNSPPLLWENQPTNTRSFVLIVEDPDAPAGTWDHWILFNLPATTHFLEENIVNLPGDTQVGVNGWGQTRYGSPCPPSGTHRYYFKLYALDTVLDLKTGAKKKEIEVSMQGHVLGEAVLVGRYKKE